MKLKILKVILVSCVILLSIACSCKRKIKNTADVEIHVFDKSLSEPRRGVEVHVFKIKKPIFSMWQFHELTRVTTDSFGVCIFKINKKGFYSLRFYDKGTLLYSIDDIEIGNLEGNKVFTIKW